MSPSRWCLIGLTALLPITVRFQTTGDSTVSFTTPGGTRIELLGGAGDYAFITRGCEGQVLTERPVSFREIGGAIEQDLGNGLSVGVRAGAMHDDIAGMPDVLFPSTTIVSTPGTVRVQLDNRYVNPYFTVAGARGSVGLGWVAHQNEFITTGEVARYEPDHPLNDVSAHIRLGSERRYFSVRWMEGVPLYSSGGYLTIGAGGHPGGGPLALYGGLAAGGPYEGAGLVLQSGYTFHGGLSAKLRTRLGTAGTRTASGVAIGLGYGEIKP